MTWRTDPARVLAFVASIASGMLVVVAVGWALGVHRRLGLVVYTEQFLAVVLGLALVVAFLRPAASALALRTAPLARPGVVKMIVDVALALTGLWATGTIAVHYAWLVEELAYDPSAGLWLSLVLVAVVLEALRRTAGLAITLLVLAFLTYGMFGYLLGGPMSARSVSTERLFTQLALDTNAIFGMPLAVAATIVTVFVLFGKLLAVSGGGAFFTDLALAAMGRYRGGAAKIAIVSSALFGSISGSAVSNVATTGTVTIGLMRRSGYPATTAGAIEAVASTGGQLMPPIMGAAAFLMAEFLGVPYAEVLLAALVPSLLYYVALFIQADLEAARKSIRPLRDDEIPDMRRTLRRGWVFVLPFIVLLSALFFWNLRADAAALYAIVTVSIIAMVRPPVDQGRLGLLWRSVTGAGAAAIDIVIITAAAGLIIGVLNISGLSFSLTLSLVRLGGDSMILLLILAAATSVVLGMGMPTVAVYVILAALVAPSLVELGVEPMAAHLFVLYFGVMSMVTPPVAVASFAAAALASADPMRTSLTAMRFGWTAYIIPFLFVGSPSLLLIGAPLSVVLAVITAVSGVGLVTAGFAGFAFTRLSAPIRALFVLAGVALMTPAGAFPGAVLTDIAGAVGAVVLVVFDLARARRLRPATG